MPLFTTDFVPPDPVTGLAIEADLLASVVRLTWDDTTIPLEDFAGFRVYRRIGEMGAWELYAETTSPAHDDFHAPLNRELSYRVTQANMDHESEPVEASVEGLLSQQWWLVDEHDMMLTFPIPKVRAATITSPKVQEVYSPLGRPDKLVIGDVVQDEDGQLSFLMTPDNPSLVAMLRAAQARMEGFVMLKAPDGSMFHTQLGSMTRVFTAVPGLQEITLPFTSGGPGSRTTETPGMGGM